MNTTENTKPLPTFGGSYGHGWQTMVKYFLILLLVVFVTGLIMAPMSLGNMDFNSHDFNWGNWGDWEDWGDWGNGPMHLFNPGIAILGVVAIIMGIFALAYSLLVVPVFKFGGDLIFVHAARDIRPQFETLVQGFKEKYLYIVLANLLTGALIMLGFIFLFIPGIIIACRLSFVSYLVMDKKMDPIVAVEESWKLTRGHGWTIFLMGFVAFFLGIIGFALMFVGILPVIIWVKSSFASLYEAVLQEKGNGQLEAAAA